MLARSAAVGGTPLGVNMWVLHAELANVRTDCLHGQFAGVGLRTKYTRCKYGNSLMWRYIEHLSYAAPFTKSAWFCAKPGGWREYDVALKFKDLFKEDPTLNKLKGSGVPWLSDFQKLDDIDEIKMDEVNQCLKENLASIVGLLIYCSLSCHPDLTTIVNMQGNAWT